MDKGLGSVVLAAALLRNAAEGHPGRLTSLDINPEAGYLARATPWADWSTWSSAIRHWYPGDGIGVAW